MKAVYKLLADKGSGGIRNEPLQGPWVVPEPPLPLSLSDEPRARRTNPRCDRFFLPAHSQSPKLRNAPLQRFRLQEHVAQSHSAFRIELPTSVAKTEAHPDRSFREA